MSKDTPTPSKLYYDGTCPMCTAFATHVAVQNNAPILLDANNESIPRPAPLPLLLEEIHLMEQNGTIRTGADAILTTLAKTHSWLTPIRDLFRLPMLRQIARLFYRFIAKRRRLWFGSTTSRLYWVFLITNLGLLSSVLLSWPLWGDIRMYPLTPFITNFSGLTQYSEILSYGLTVTLIAGLLTITRQRQTAALATILLVTLILLDQTRLQPWVWHYGIVLALFSFWQPTQPIQNKHLTFALLWLVAGIYFWSGIQKMNIAFFTEVFPWFTQTLAAPFGTLGTGVFFSLGIFIPLIESLIAIGLLTNRYRRTALLTALAMHLLVLACLMVGRDWNSSVWPWNIALFATAIALFAGNKSTFKEILKRVRHNLFAYSTVGLFILLPLGNFFGLSHHYLSWSLYSGHVPTAYLTAEPALIRSLAPTATTIPNPDGNTTLSFVNFAMTDFNAAPYPETPLFLAIFRTLCETYPAHPLTLTVVERPLLLSHETMSTDYRCNE